MTAVDRLRVTCLSIHTMTSWILPGLLLLVYLVTESLGSTRFIYMTSYCSRTLEINTSLSLALTSENLLNHDRENMDFVHCALDVTSPSGWKLFVHFLQMSIAPETHHVDRVELYNMDPEKVRITPPQGLYGKLERSLFMFDDSGMFIEDYKTEGRKLRIDYLGKPTVKNPGFRVLVTAVQEPDSSDKCPERWFHCGRQKLCVPTVTTCDGFQNCGMDDASDEAGCDLDNKITNLLEEYSLARDILLAVILPLVAFIVIVIIMILCARRHIKKKYPDPEPPAVHFSPRKGGQVQIDLHQNRQELNRLYAPPSYEDIMRPSHVEPPPAYSSLANLASEGAILVGSEESLRRVSPRDWKRNRSRQVGKDDSDSVSSVDASDSKEENSSRKVTQYERYRRYKSCPSDSDNDDEETRRKRRRKGAGVKGKGKRRADDLSLELRSEPRSGSQSHRVSSLTPHGPSPLASSSPSSPSSQSVPYASSTSTDISSKQSSSVTSTPDHKTTAAVIPVSVAPERTLLKQSSGEFIPIHVKYSSEERPLQNDSNKNDSPKFESSGTEADRKSETESTSPCKRNSFTESLSSSVENVKQKLTEMTSPDQSLVERYENNDEIDEIKRKTRGNMANGRTEAKNGRASVK